MHPTVDSKGAAEAVLKEPIKVEPSPFIRPLHELRPMEAEVAKLFTDIVDKPNIAYNSENFPAIDMIAKEMKMDADEVTVNFFNRIRVMRLLWVMRHIEQTYGEGIERINAGITPGQSKSLLDVLAPASDELPIAGDSVMRKALAYVTASVLIAQTNLKAKDIDKMDAHARDWHKAHLAMLTSASGLDFIASKQIMFTMQIIASAYNES